jgi:hypothetical protein
MNGFALNHMTVAREAQPKGDLRCGLDGRSGDRARSCGAASPHCGKRREWGAPRIVANLRKKDTDGQDVVAYIAGAKTGPEYEGAA